MTGGDGRHPGRHRLHDHQAERLQPRRGRHHGDRARDGLLALRRVQQADVTHVVPTRGPGGHLRLQRPGAGDHERYADTAARRDLVPRGHEQPYALGLREPAEIEHVLAVTGSATARIRHEVVLHRQPLGRHAGPHQDVALRGGDAEEPLHAGPPAPPVDRQADRERHGRQAGVAVAAVPDGGQRCRADALGARPAVPLERAGRADLGVVVQRGDGGHPGVGAGGEHRGRQEREDVVDVHHVRPLGAQQGGEFRAHRRVPRHQERHRDLAEEGAGADVVAAPLEHLDPVAGRAQQLHLLVDHLVLPARLCGAVAVVHHDDVHAQVTPDPRAQRGMCRREASGSTRGTAWAGTANSEAARARWSRYGEASPSPASV